MIENFIQGNVYPYQQRITELEAETERLSFELKATTNELEIANAVIERLKARVNEVIAEANATYAELQAAKGKITQLREAIRTHIKDLKDQSRRWHRTGTLGIATTTLSSWSANLAGRLQKALKEEANG